MGSFRSELKTIVSFWVRLIAAVALVLVLVSCASLGPASTRPPTWPAVGDEIGATLGCTDVALPEYRIVDTEWYLDCAGFEDVNILLFRSESQRDSYFQMVASGRQAVIGEAWAVTDDSEGAPLGVFDTADQAALALGGVVVRRSFPGSGLPPPPVGLMVPETEASNLLTEGVDLASGGHRLSAIPLFNQVISGISPSDVRLAPLRASALLDRGIAYGYEDQNTQALSTAEAIWSYEWLYADYAHSNDPQVRRSVVAGTYFLGLIKRNQDNYGAALAWFDRVAETGVGSTDPEVELLMADALWVKAGVLVDLGSTDDASVVLRELIDTYSNSTARGVDEIIEDAQAALEGFGPSASRSATTSAAPETTVRTDAGDVAGTTIPDVCPTTGGVAVEADSRTPSEVTLGVLNSTDTEGLGVDLVVDLAALGYQVQDRGAYRPALASGFIYYAPGFHLEAFMLCPFLGGAAIAENPSAEPVDDLLVILGSDYSE